MSTKVAPDVQSRMSKVRVDASGKRLDVAPTSLSSAVDALKAHQAKTSEIAAARRHNDQQRRKGAWWEVDAHAELHEIEHKWGIMGSDSDLPTMRAAAEVLESFDVPYEITVVSAHRTPQRMYDYARGAAANGLRVIIAGAGGAAHLPGMVAALTPLPVVGVPVKTSTLSGNDSLLSIVQMPKGIPVATVAIGNAANAALLAVRMLGISEPKLLDAMAAYMEAQEATVLEKAARLEEKGYRGYE